LSMEQSAISHQLKTLKTSRLVKSKRVGKNMIYSLDDLHIFSILEQVSTHIEEQEK
ncbi:MAG: helix-turn-helix transcriptional regulator, partial [Enterococcus sp.]|nr:helix-turn-helix transcriptional regulator [Enterococcus sp.]